MAENDEKYWDDQLDKFGIDGVIWQQGDDYGRAETRDITILFKELIKDERGEHRLAIKVPLRANQQQTRYDRDELPKELTDRKIESIWAEVTNQPYNRSRIHLKLHGVEQAVVILKRY